MKKRGKLRECGGKAVDFACGNFQLPCTLRHKEPIWKVAEFVRIRMLSDRVTTNSATFGATNSMRRRGEPLDYSRKVILCKVGGHVADNFSIHNTLTQLILHRFFRVGGQLTASTDRSSICSNPPPLGRVCALARSARQSIFRPCSPGPMIEARQRGGRWISDHNDFDWPSQNNPGLRYYFKI
jgi:hypothetical protein